MTEDRKLTFMAEQILSFRDLRVYKSALELQQAVFQTSKVWPRDEKFSLTDQVRRSSRSVGANIAESWAKRNYPSHFTSKLTDADGELQETSHWLSTALACGHIICSEHMKFQARIEEIGKMLGKMMSMPEKFCPEGRGRKPDVGSLTSDLRLPASSFGIMHITDNLGRERHSVRAASCQFTRSAGRGLPALPSFVPFSVMRIIPKSRK
jgi:four helix bundle protein